jgi:hypothetical protein
MPDKKRGMLRKEDRSQPGSKKGQIYERGHGK